MIAISVKQPWAYLLCAGIKGIENRTWKLPDKYKGKRVLIQASGKPIMKGNCISHFMTEDQYSFITLNTSTGKELNDICFLEHYSSAIIGSVVFTDCVINHSSVWAEKTHMAKLGECELPSCLYPPYKPIYNWVASDPILFDKPIPAKGKLSFWDYPNIGCEQDEDGKDVCCCHLGIPEKDQVLSYGGGDYRCKYCGEKWYK